MTCQDARLDPAKAFGIALGEAHVIRNAGGDAADSIRSLVISQQMLGTNAIFLVKHTGEPTPQKISPAEGGWGLAVLTPCTCRLWDAPL